MKNNKEPLLSIRLEGESIGTDFRCSQTLEELAAAQGVRPIENAEVLLGTWPGEIDDGFEEAIRTLRQNDLVGGSE